MLAKRIEELEATLRRVEAEAEATVRRMEEEAEAQLAAAREAEAAHLEKLQVQEQRLRDLQADMEKLAAQAWQEEMVVAVSHELRT